MGMRGTNNTVYTMLHLNLAGSLDYLDQITCASLSIYFTYTLASPAGTLISITSNDH